MLKFVSIATVLLTASLTIRPAFGMTQHEFTTEVCYGIARHAEELVERFQLGESKLSDAISQSETFTVLQEAKSVRGSFDALKHPIGTDSEAFTRYWTKLVYGAYDSKLSPIEYAERVLTECVVGG